MRQDFLNPEEIPDGGGIIVKIKGDIARAEYVFVSDSIIYLDGVLYKDTSGNFDSLISELTEIL